jgi:hypothetical protein
MQEITFINSVFTIKIGTLIAGLLGASIRTLRKTDGSLQARIIYVIPFITWFLMWKFGVVLETPAENLLSFVLGMLSQTITENFIDDPLGTISNGVTVFKKLKTIVWKTNEPVQSITPAKILPNEGNTSEDAK